MLCICYQYTGFWFDANVLCVKIDVRFQVLFYAELFLTSCYCVPMELKFERSACQDKIALRHVALNV